MGNTALSACPKGLTNQYVGEGACPQPRLRMAARPSSHHSTSLS